MDRQIVCARWGTKYGPDYVNRLWGMLRRNLTGPFRLICFTDDAAGIRPEVECMDLPDLGAPMPQGVTGIWGKTRFWKAGLGGLTGTYLFMDLDIVVTGPMDGFFEHGDPGDVVLARNPNTPFERLGQTSIYRAPVGALDALRERFLADPQGIAERYRYEQRFVSREAPGGVSFWPKGWAVVFKWHCVPQFPLNYARAPRLPKDARVVLFPGPLNPPDAIAGRWSRRSEPRGGLDHVRAAFDGRRTKRESAYQHLRHYVRPAPWVAEHWRG